MSNPRHVNDLSAWAYIMKTSPELLKTQKELNLSEAKTLPLRFFSKVCEALVSGKVQDGFCITMPTINQITHQMDVNIADHIKLIARALKSNKTPKNFELKLCASFFNFESSEGKDLIDALKSGQCPEGFILNLDTNFLTTRIYGFAEALASGGCPENFTCVLNNTALDY
jgi:hypothetical protein